MQSIADFADTDALAAAARRARRFGFEGATCVHPGAVPVLNAAFTPDDAELAEAERIVAAMQAGLARGDGAVRLDGRMIDAPVAAQAQRVIAMARRGG
jgi:citrate lyase subunit beta/citryl-CoA lyase